MTQTLYLIDGHAQTYRAFYAVEGLHAPDGRPTGAVFGFTRMLMDTLRRHSPDYIAVVFDTPAPTFRHKAYEAYKATRKPMPQALIDQIPVIQEVVQAFRIPIFTLDGYEADDVIGTLARQALDKNLEVVLVSGDKDLGQLLEPRVRLYDPRKDLFIDAGAYRKNKGFPPELLPDVLGLMGDSSDNIPGVPGVGEKTASKLLREYGSLEEILAHADEIPGKLGERLRSNVQGARLSRELATIDCRAPVTLELEDCRRAPPDETHLLALYDDLGFESLKKNLPPALSADKEEAKTRDYRLVDTAEAFRDFLPLLKKERHLAFDVETTSADPMRAELVGMSFSWKPRTGWYLPFRAPEGEPFLDTQVIERLKPLLSDPDVAKTGHNLKYDTLVMRRAGIPLQGISFDSMLASHLVSGHLRGHSLDAVASRLLHVKTTTIDELIGKGKKQITMDRVPVERVSPYAAEDADIALRLEAALRPRLAEEGLLELFQEVELPLSRVLTDMQAWGIRLDARRLADMSREMERELERLTGEIHYLAGHPFNIASPKQLAEVLFDELKFPVVRRTKTGRSTDEQVLSDLATVKHPKQALLKLLLRYRTYAKLKSTYIDALPQMVNPDTGRIHTTFHQTGTATGRLSSSDPNLQNIPVRSEEGRGIRAAFVPEEGWELLSSDYSQIELRMLAHFSGDAALREAFDRGKDIHVAVAAQVFGTPESEVTPEERRAAKAVNFGIIYGQTAFGLSQATEMNRGEARRFIERYFQSHPRVDAYLKETIAAAHEQGRVRTILGRKREIPELASSNKTQRTQAERMAVNTVLQGSAADLIKKAMIAIHRRLGEEGLKSRMILQIHDELVLECPPKEVTRAKAIVRKEMEGAMRLEVPLVVDLGVGSNWLEVK
ncbi:MAG: DNA polymerase I [Planctomycetota bacterium]